jgi:transposase
LTLSEEEGQRWAVKMKALLIKSNEQTEEAGGALGVDEQKRVRQKYRAILREAEAECPPPPPKPPGQKGKVKKSKSRNLLERLRDYEDDTLRFMTAKNIPFTNNLAERDLRMAKVHDKVSGCFRDLEHAKAHCLIRSYISTSVKHGVDPYAALSLLFEGKQPDFMLELAE